MPVASAASIFLVVSSLGGALCGTSTAATPGCAPVSP
jgi:hypothetical protein